MEGPDRAEVVSEPSSVEVDADLVVDSAGLGYTFRRGEIFVHYPVRAHGVRDDSGSRYGTGWPIGPVPATYALEPPNEITAERVRLWHALAARAAREGGE